MSNWLTDSVLGRRLQKLDLDKYPHLGQTVSASPGQARKRNHIIISSMSFPPAFPLAYSFSSTITLSLNFYRFSLLFLFLFRRSSPLSPPLIASTNISSYPFLNGSFSSSHYRSCHQLPFSTDRQTDRFPSPPKHTSSPPTHTHHPSPLLPLHTHTFPTPCLRGYAHLINIIKSDELRPHLIFTLNWIESHYHAGSNDFSPSLEPNMCDPIPVSGSHIVYCKVSFVCLSKLKIFVKPPSPNYNQDRGSGDECVRHLQTFGK